MSTGKITPNEFFENMGYQGGAIHFVIDGLIDQFDTKSKGNFISMTFGDDKGRDFEVLLSKTDGVTTTDKLNEQEDRIVKLENMLKELVKNKECDVFEMESEITELLAQARGE